MGILGLQSYACFDAGEPNPLYFLCTLTALSSNGEARLTSIEWPKDSGSRVVKSEALSRATRGMGERWEQL